MFELAKNSIENVSKGVGLSERFDETLFLVEQALGLSKVHYKRVNRTLHPRLEQVSAAAIDLLRERNRYDLLLYDYVQNRLDMQLRKQPPSLRRSLQFFQALNWFCGTPYEAVQFTKRRLLNTGR
jgi:hypothetical protein